MEPEYERWYEDTFTQVDRLCELGIYSGASVKWWNDRYEPSVHVGVDVHNAAPGRYTHIQGRQEDAATLERVRKLGPYDLIVDDCSHEGDDAEVSFVALWPVVVPGGCYVIEDWQAPWLHSEPGGDIGLVTLVTRLVRRVGLSCVNQPELFKPFGTSDIESAVVRPGIAAFWKVTDARSGA